ncbi:suppressor of fused domain protein [Bradyrhizobium manausense]|uniref:suppressor of fused domain protein n=1 Tax=Bradyrhizobium TaxID=374 RepID=UPI001BACAE1C|nr:MULTISPECIES: suppressor of fused domain protein [Bradyrhizobium]MBR0824310.1 suppressor of fused domain protein [Bradyrhizobium manausense]UVO26710.1 suppressor of fused domain protein [Bradyrhizobium arachidis]
MLSRLTRFLSGSSEPTQSANSYQQRLAIYEQELGEPEHSFADTGELRIDIHAYGRDFVPDCEEGSDEGYVLLTNGMSERRMPPTDRADKIKSRAELMWYVRDPTQEICTNLRWLARLPFIDSKSFAFGDRVPLPTPPLIGSEFRTFLFLTPIIGPDQRTAEALTIGGDEVEILTVNLISDRELDFIKTHGLDDFLDLLDENDYPPIFDPKRKSYV